MQHVSTCIVYLQIYFIV